VYDMYPWDSASQGDYPPEPMRSRRTQKTRETSPARAVQIALRAVQIALDRRDNGGDAAAAAPHASAAAPPAATPPAAAPPAASAPATPPTASLTRQ
jgi:hypothetical protein